MRTNRKLILLLMMILVFTFSIADTNEKPETKTDNSEVAEYFGVYDPWEPLNRRIYYFNYTFDKYVFLPVVDAYNLVTPTFVQKGVKNFFRNTQNITITGNSLLQFKIKKAMRAIGRFSINATLGAGGVFDTASSLGMPKPYEDFGLTLAHYGVGEGPYLILPFLGPSNLRDAVGTGVNTVALGALDPYEAADLFDIDSPEVFALNSVDKRKNTKFRYYASGSPFEYEYLRFFYKKYRKLQSETGVQLF